MGASREFSRAAVPVWGFQQWPQDWKKSVFIAIPKKSNAKECWNYHTILLKILQARLQQYVNHEFPDVQVGFRKGRGTRDQIANISWKIEKAREFQKNIISALLTDKAFDSVDQHKPWEYQTTRPASWEIQMQFKKEQLELYMEQQTGSK